MRVVLLRMEWAIAHNCGDRKCRRRAVDDISLHWVDDDLFFPFAVVINIDIGVRMVVVCGVIRRRAESQLLRRSARHGIRSGRGGL